MMLSPLIPGKQQGITVSRFLGYDAGERCENGGFSAMENLTGDGWPALCPRGRRGTVAQCVQGRGMIAKDALCWVDGTTLYVNGEATQVTLTAGKKQLVGMGAYLLVWPDKKYINTQNLNDWGSLENTVTVTGQVQLGLCSAEGRDYTAFAASAAAPADPETGALWMDTGEKALYRFDGAAWQAVEDVCLKLSAAGIGVGFRPGDGVEVEGLSGLSGCFPVKKQAAGFLVLSGPWESLGQETATVTVRRYVPEMDFVVECGNRLWGCKYGMVDGEPVNEIYASALGDFRNFRTFQGLSTDAYAAQRGSDGPFTGAVSFLGNPLFFKENGLEKVYPSASGAHQIIYTPCPGVARGSSESLAVVDSSLYYHGVGGIYRYDGAMPVKVSEKLGNGRFHDAVAGGEEGKYYVSLLDETDQPHLFTYDTVHRLWHRQDDLRPLAFAACGGEMYAMTDSSILALKGTDGVLETAPVSWFAQTGPWGLEAPEHHYLLRLDLQLQLAAGAEVQVEWSGDDGVHWTCAGHLRGTGGREKTRWTVRPRRAARVCLRLSGRGEAAVDSITAVYRKGSDVV